MNEINAFMGDYRFLSNFWLAEVEYDGLTYSCVECAYQAAKNFDRERRKMFLGLTPGQAKREGRKTLVRPDWNEVKVLIMTELVRKKFTSHAALKEKLLATGDVPLIEGNRWGDCFWGICDGKGENHLGKILMEVREELKRAQEE
jgi:hypothetical protein